jgi:hypothetical protein
MKQDCAQNEGGAAPSEETAIHAPNPLIQLLTIKELVWADKSSEGHIRNLIASGELPSYKSGDLVRVLLPDYLAYLNRRKEEQRRKIETRAKRLQANEQVPEPANDELNADGEFASLQTKASQPEGQ